MPEQHLAVLGREAVATASLTEVLEARDRRAALQGQLLAVYGLPVLSLTLVSPGPVKDSPSRRRLMDMAEAALRDETRAAGLRVRQRSRTDGIAGPEALWIVEAPPDPLKRLAIGIEASRPWGRLLDVDVLLADARRAPVSLQRQTLGFEPRRCLVCDAAAKECLASRRHHPDLAIAIAMSLLGRCMGQP